MFLLVGAALLVSLLMLGNNLVFASFSTPETRFFFFLYSDKYIRCQLISVHVYAEFSYFLLAGAAVLDSLPILGLNIVFASFSIAL
jgi:hypothetical protein